VALSVPRGVYLIQFVRIVMGYLASVAGAL